MIPTYKVGQRICADHFNQLTSFIQGGVSGPDLRSEPGAIFAKRGFDVTKQLAVTATVAFPAYSVGIISDTAGYDATEQRIRCTVDSYNSQASPKRYHMYYVTNGPTAIAAGQKGWVNILEPYTLYPLAGNVASGLCGPNGTGGLTVLNTGFGFVSFAAQTIDGVQCSWCMLDDSQVITARNSAIIAAGAMGDVTVQLLSKTGGLSLTTSVVSAKNPDPVNPIPALKDLHCKRIANGNTFIIDFVLC